MIPVAYNYRNLLVRWRTTLMTSCGFTLVVMALIVMLAFVNGVRVVCARSGQPENVIVTKQGTSDEVLSQLTNHMVRQVEMMPGVLRGADGRPLCSRELFMVITQWNDRTQEYRYVQARGVEPMALEVHSHVRLAEGRMFRSNSREMIVGRGMARQEQIEVGQALTVGQIDWQVVGIFEADGSAFETEAWCDVNQLAGQFHRDGFFSTAVLRTIGPAAAAELAARLRQSRAVAVEAQPESEYYEQQAEQTNIIYTGALVISVFMAFGAVLGVTNTMFAAIGERIADIAVMRLLGFRRGEILASFLLEALLIALIGGVMGSLLGYAVNGWTLETALGAKSVAFAFQVDASILAVGAAFALAMGIVGGLLPALAAMRVEPLEAMR